MKRAVKITLTFLLILAVSTVSAFATEVSVNFNKVNIEVNGGLKAAAGEFFVRTTGDVPYSILYQGTTYLPLAKVCEFVGKDVRWDGETRTVYISTPTEAAPEVPDTQALPAAYQELSIDATFDSLNIVVNGQYFAYPGTQFDRGGGLMVPYSLLYRGTTYLPLAAVCQIVGKDVSWDAESFTAKVADRVVLDCYALTDVPDYGMLCGLPLSAESASDDLMVYNYYDYGGTVRQGQEADDLQRYVAQLFDAGFVFSLEDSRKLVGDEETKLYAYRHPQSERIVVIGLVQAAGLSQAVVSYKK